VLKKENQNLCLVLSLLWKRPEIFDQSQREWINVELNDVFPLAFKNHQSVVTQAREKVRTTRHDRSLIGAAGAMHSSFYRDKEYINLKVRTERNQGNKQIDKQSKLRLSALWSWGESGWKERRKKEITPFCRLGDAVKWRFMLSVMQFNAFQPRSCILKL